VKHYLMIATVLATTTLFAQANDMETVKAVAKETVKKVTVNTPVTPNEAEKTAKTLEKKVPADTASKH